MTTAYRSAAQAHNPRSTPQTSPIPGREADMVKNSAGGYSFKVSPWTQLDRFLVLGTESNTYYTSAKELTEDNAVNVVELIKKNGVGVVKRIVEISQSGRAPKNEPALFALALVMTYGDDKAKQAAYAVIPAVARIGTHVLHLAEYVNSMRGWGRGIRRAFGNWYIGQDPKSLAMNLVKYARRDGWTHRDILRLAHPSSTGVHQQLLAYVAQKEFDFTGTNIQEFMDAVLVVKSAGAEDAGLVAMLVNEFRLPREVIPTELLNDPLVWEALLPHMGSTALIRNLATLTRLGLAAPMSATERLILDKLGDVETIKKDRVHPIHALAALITYNRGQGARGNHVWTPNSRIASALDALFYASFVNVVPTGKRFYLGIDVSLSMTEGEVAGVPGLRPNIAAAAMAMVTARTERDYYIAGFADSMRNLGISDRDTLESAMRKTEGMSFGRTDCALAIHDALKNKIEVDTFVIYTDNEMWSGAVHPSQMLNRYRTQMGIPSKLIAVGMTAINSSIADPLDAGMLDVVGFDSATPNLIADFSRE